MVRSPPPLQQPALGNIRVLPVWLEVVFQCKTRLANQLFYVSRAVSEDARAVLYSRNRFSVDSDRHSGLLPLKYLTSTALRALRSIQVGVEVQRLRGEEYLAVLGGGECEEGYEEAAGKFREEEQARKRAILPEWLYFCSRLVTVNVKPDQLELTISGSFIDVPTTQAFLAPLLALPRLRDCSIRAGLVHDKDLQLFIEGAVKQLTKRPKGYSSNGPANFPFTKLPGEIQLQILGQTDLIPPSSDVITWVPPMGFVPRACKHAQYSGYLHCPSTRVAYSSCNYCWQIPTVLFLTNRRTRHQGKSIFFSRNRFSLKLSTPWSTHSHTHYDHDYDYGSAAQNPNKSLGDSLPLSLSLYPLTPFPKNCLQHLHHLEWDFDAPKIETHALLPGETNHALWLEALDLLAQYTPLLQLTLVLDMTRETREFRNAMYVPGNHRNENFAPRKWEYYRGIVKPVVAKLCGLKDFFVRISWPLEIAMEKVRDEMEMKMERMVMGEGYDSFKRGKTLTRIQLDA